MEIAPLVERRCGICLETALEISESNQKEGEGEGERSNGLTVALVENQEGGGEKKKSKGKGKSKSKGKGKEVDADLFRKLAIEKAEKEVFLTICPSANSHPICHGCTTNMLTHHIHEGTLRSLCCPYPDCPHTKEVMDFNLVKALVSQPVFERYERLLLNDALEKMPDIRWCPRKTRNAEDDTMQICGQPVIVSFKKRQGRCAACDFCFCITCNEPSHYGPCEENIHVDPETKAWLKENTKSCANCFTPIQKNGGCNHMTCQRCGIHFNWETVSFKLVKPRHVASKNPKGTSAYNLMSGTRLKPVEPLPFSLLPSNSDSNSGSDSSSGSGANASKGTTFVGKDKRLTKKCPICGQLAEKLTHSNHLSCKKCNSKFCFLCGFLAKSATAHFQPGAKCVLFSTLPTKL